MIGIVFFILYNFNKQKNKMDIILAISIAVGCLILGGVIGFVLFRYIIKQQYNQIVKEAEIEAESLKEKKQLELKEKFLNRKSELDKEANQRNQKLQSYENKLKQRELSLNQQNEEIQKKQHEIDAQKENITKQQEKLNTLITEQRSKLETISGLTTEEARESLIESLKDEAKSQAQQYINEIIDDAVLMGKPMILISNLDKKAIEQRYGERVASRLNAFEIIQFFGTDIRQKKK